MIYIEEYKLSTTKYALDYFKCLMDLFISNDYVDKISCINIYQDEINYLFLVRLYTAVNPGDNHSKFIARIKPFTDIANGLVLYSELEVSIKITADKDILEKNNEFLNVHRSLLGVTKFDL